MPARSSSFKAASGQLGSLPVSAIPSRECPDLGMKRLVSCHCCFPRSLTCLNTGDFLHPPRGGDESKSGPLEDGRLIILLPAVPPALPPTPLLPYGLARAVFYLRPLSPHRPALSYV